MIKLITLILAGVGLVNAAVAADSVVLHDVNVIDGTGAAPLPHRDVLIQDGRIGVIEAVPKGGQLPHGTVITLSGRSLLPGIISNHSHLGLTDGKNAGGQYATTANILRQLRQYERYGVTSVISLGLNQRSFYELAPKSHAGEVPGADMFGADRGFGVPDGAPPAAMGVTTSQVYRPRSIDEARAQVRETAGRHPHLVKIWVDDFHGQVSQKLSPPIYQAIIQEAHAQGLRVAAHVYYLADAKQLVADGVDVLAHGVRDVPVDDEFIAAMKAHHVWYIPTLGLDESSYLFAEHPELAEDPLLARALQPALADQLADPAWRAGVLGNTQKLAADKRSLAMNEKNLKAVFDAGVQVGFGTDSGATPLRIAGFAEHRELQLLVASGLTPLEAISLATHQAASLLELEDRGVIAPGKLADVMVVEGDPSKTLSDINRIVAVWHRGKQVAGTLESGL